jgi:hypothetical protein
MIRHVAVHHTAAVMRQDDEDKQHPEGRLVGTVKKSIEAVCFM